MGTWGPHPEAIARTTDEARAGRSERERRLLADPASAVAATRDVLASGGEAAERFFHVGFEISYAAYSRRDWELNTLFIDADNYVFRAAAGHEMIDAAGDFHGLSGYLEAQDLLLDIWGDLHVELDGVVVLPPDRVVTTMAWRGHAARAGVAMEWRAVTDHWFREGLAVVQTFWWDRQRAVRDLGFALPGQRR